MAIFSNSVLSLSVRPITMRTVNNFSEDDKENNAFANSELVNSRSKTLKTPKERDDMFRSLQQLHASTKKGRRTKQITNAKSSHVVVLPASSKSKGYDYTQPLEFDHLGLHSSDGSLDSDDEPSTPTTRRVKFQCEVYVKEIPSRHDHDEESRRSMWNSLDEIEDNAQRSSKEFKVDSCDWRKATEEQGFLLWQEDENDEAQLVHPATHQELKREQERRQQEQEHMLSRFRVVASNKDAENSSCYKKRQASFRRSETVFSFGVFGFEIEDYSYSEDDDSEHDLIGLTIEGIDEWL